MKRYEFVADAKTGTIEIPKKYKNICKQDAFRVIILTNEKSTDPLFTALSIDTTNLKFNRREIYKS